MAYSGGAASAAAPGNKGLKGIIAGEKSQLVKLDAFFFSYIFMASTPLTTLVNSYVVTAQKSPCI